MPFWLSLWHFNFSSKKKKNYVQDHSMFILFSKFFSRYSKAQSSRENKKKWNKWTVFWSIKFSSSSYSNLSSSVVVGRLNNVGGCAKAARPTSNLLPSPPSPAEVPCHLAAGQAGGRRRRGGDGARWGVRAWRSQGRGCPLG